MKADDFHLARSAVLDAFATAEREILIVLERNSSALGATVPLAQKIDRLKTLKPNPKLSKARHTALQQALPIFEGAVQARNDLVHARLCIAEVGGPVAIYRNVGQTGETFEVARVMTLACHQRLAKIASDFANLLSPPPSPPRPSRGAAAGP